LRCDAAFFTNGCITDNRAAGPRQAGLFWRGRKITVTRIILGGLLSAWSVPSPAATDPKLPEVIVVGDLTKAGKQARVPDSDHPVYYMPLTPGRYEKDAAPEGKNEPPKSEVLSQLMGALAKRHYLPATTGHPPELVLSFWWGSVKPEIDYNVSEDLTQADFTNQRAMAALVGADKRFEMEHWHPRNLEDAATQDRHYVIVTAFDYAAAVQKQKKVMWITRMSMPSAGVDLAAAIPALVTTGGPAFGRDALPAWIDSSKMQDEHVKLAPLEVIGVVPEKKK